MINKECYSREWIYSFREQPRYKKVDLVALEKMILALSLVEQLSLQGLDFIFKGGTSLSLLLKEPKRFSIDVDIITSVEKDEIDKVLERICAGSNFKNFTFDERRSFSHGIPKAHYKLFFNSGIDSAEGYILLDILFEENTYPELLELEIKNLFLITEGEPLNVKVPSIDSIAGDKLTAFAPHTIGIGFGREKELEIIKQLFDLGVLFEYTSNYETISQAYIKTAQKEIEYRKLDIDYKQSLLDTFNSSLILARREKNKDEDLAKFRLFQKGLLQFPSYIITGNFTIESAIESAAKASMMAVKLLKTDFSPVEKINKTDEIEKYLINNPDYNFLNRTKKLDNDALFYWYHAIKTLEK